MHSLDHNSQVKTPSVVPLEGGTLRHQKEHEMKPLGTSRPREANGSFWLWFCFCPSSSQLGHLVTEACRHDSEADRLPNHVFHQFQATPGLASLRPPSWPPPPHPPTPFQSLQGNFPAALIWLLFLKASSQLSFLPQSSVFNPHCQEASFLLRDSLPSLHFLQLLPLLLCLFTSSSSRKPSLVKKE